MNGASTRTISVLHVFVAISLVLGKCSALLRQWW
jgi:hypothetical protein